MLADPPLAETLVAEAVAMRLLQASILDATDIGTHAVEYALHHWAVIPVRGKDPAIRSPHPGVRCKGDCGKQGHGVLDATTSVPAVICWWAGRYAGCNIGVRVPETMMVLDIDIWKGGGPSWSKLIDEHGPLPHCLTTLTGHWDGSRHLFMRRPPGKLSTAKLGPGIDLRTHGNYVVAAPSIHPDTGKRYLRVDGPIIDPPHWLVDLLTVKPPTPIRHRSGSGISRPGVSGQASVADEFNARTTWSDILMPHGWACLDADPDSDGARWLHPTHTSKQSATISGGRLYVYSTSTAFTVTAAGDRYGYSKFEAYALLEHRSDMKAAARQLLSSKGVA